MDSPTDVAPTAADGPASLEEFTRLLYRDPPSSTTATIEETVEGIRKDRDASAE